MEKQKEITEANSTRSLHVTFCYNSGDDNLNSHATTSVKRKVVSNKKYLRYRNLIIIDRSYICFFHVLFCMQDHVLEYNLYLVKKNNL